jgi:hypothetical protein
MWRCRTVRSGKGRRYSINGRAKEQQRTTPEGVFNAGEWLPASQYVAARQHGRAQGLRLRLLCLVCCGDDGTDGPHGTDGTDGTGYLMEPPIGVLFMRKPWAVACCGRTDVLRMRRRNPEVYRLHARDLRSILVPALPGWGRGLYSGGAAGCEPGRTRLLWGSPMGT